MQRTKKIFQITALAAVTSVSTLTAASASGYNQFIGFGDSTMDSGYFRYSPTGGSPLLPPGASIDVLIAATVAAGGSGAFMGPGVVDTIQIAQKFGLAANPVTMPGGGTNYANGSAQTYSTTQDNGFANGLYNNVPVTAQVTNYLASVNGHANPNALYMFSIGGNDLAWLDAQVAIDHAAYIRSLSNALSSSIISLHAAGAQHIMVLSPYSYARTVEENGYVSPANQTNIEESSAYASQVRTALQAAGVNFIPVDIEGVLKYVSQHPTQFGFTPESVLAKNQACGPASALICSPAQLVSPDAEQTHLWSDSHHLTTAGQTIETDFMYSLLTAPTNISLIAEAPIQSGLSRNATIQRQVELSGMGRGQIGINAWASAGYGYTKTETESYFPSDSGNPFQGTIGADYQTVSGIVLGGALTAGYQSQDFSTGGGFDQDEQTMSFYSAYQHEQYWGNVIASYGFLQNDINRSVKLGIFTDQNDGEADGHSISLALRGGSDFKIGQFTTGPVVGVLFQETHIDGFTETGTTGVTALSFNSQTRESQVTQLGWRGSIELGKWKPFAEATWNHEWNDDDRTVTTTLTSVLAPSYTTLVTPVASDWGNATVGVSYKISPKILLWGAFSEVFGSSENTNYGGELGLSVSF
ncbi:autotransporter domain-containing protein [uncultured Desulfobulbus sp.]|uniref:autotransporter outer membrane beta-barrel domain-containing protein n=1 Tax=uncultured Desulfobulbus sp. TaxID=239745 RepID=UPI0029C864AD|nr:autotransporter domain-containing protein [uncultured Desulfobulbus sp.]